MYSPTSPLRFKVGATVKAPHPGIFLWPLKGFACMFWQIAKVMAPVAMSVVEIEYDTADVIVNGPARVIGNYEFMDRVSQEIAILRGKVVGVIAPIDAIRFAGEERRRLHADMDEWAIGRSPAELALLPKMLELQLAAILQPGGLNAGQVEKLQRVGAQLASFEANRLAAAGATG